MDLVQTVINGGGGLALIILAYRVVQLERQVKTLTEKADNYRRDFHELKDLTIEFVMIFKNCIIQGANGQMKAAVAKWAAWRDKKK